jgi:peptide/nickel transport system permease protein
MAVPSSEITLANQAEPSAPEPRARRRKLPRTLVIGGGILCLVVILAILGPIISPYPYDEIAPRDRFQGPSISHFLGTDEYGRDVLSRTLYGSRLSLFLGFSATFISLVVGVLLGLIGGYARGRIDEIIMRCLDVLISFPPIMLVLLLLSVTEPALWKTSTAIGLLFVPAIARIVRSVTLGLVAEEFITAAKARGESTWYILRREILPNAWPAIMVEASLRVTFAILVGAVLSFLGFGVQPPSADWGLMISQARGYLREAPWIALTPGFAMCVTVLAVNLLGDGLREYLDPRERRMGSA